MSKKSFSMLLLSVCLLSAFLMSATAQTRTVGVNVGDSYKYGVAVSWNSNDPNATFPPPDWEMLEEMNETEWVSFAVEDVISSNVTLQFMSHYTNGTEKVDNDYIDVDTGEGNMTYAVVSTNLDVNDTVYASPDFSTWKINETLVRSYPDGARDTNRINQTSTWTYNETSLYRDVNYYWDKSTGIVVEDSYVVRNQTGDYLTAWSMSFIINDSNVWTIPEFSTLLTPISFMITTFLAAAICRRKHSF